MPCAAASCYSSWSGLSNQGGSPMFHQPVETGFRKHSDGNCPEQGAGTCPWSVATLSANGAYKHGRKIWLYNNGALTTYVF